MPVALANQLTGLTSFASSNLLLHSNPMLLPFQNTRRGTRFRKTARFPVAAISQNFMKTTLRVHAEKAVQFKVRAVVTVRNKIREDFRETMLKHLDAISDRIGTRNVVLELISNDIDPSKPITITSHLSLHKTRS